MKEMFIKTYILYPSFFLAVLVGCAVGGSISNDHSVNKTLKMCNQNPLECKFKYDILKYKETGKVPYKVEIKEDKKVVTKK